MRYVWIILLGFMACTDPEREAAIIEDLVEEGVAKYKLEKKMACRSKLLEEADVIVDSLLLSVAFYEKVDTFVKPIRPTRPLNPERWPERDTSSIGPLFDSIP